MSPHNMIWQLHCLSRNASTSIHCGICSEQQTGMQDRQLQHSCVQAAVNMCKAGRAFVSFHDVGKAWAVCKAIYIRVSWCTCKSLVLGAQVSQHGVPQAQLLGCATHTLLCPNPTPHYSLLHTLVHVTSSHTQNRYNFIIGALRRHWPACCCLAWCMLQVSQQGGPALCLGSPSNAAPTRMVQVVSSLPQQEAEHA